MTGPPCPGSMEKDGLHVGFEESDLRVDEEISGPPYILEELDFPIGLCSLHKAVVHYIACYICVVCMTLYSI